MGLCLHGWESPGNGIWTDKISVRLPTGQLLPLSQSLQQLLSFNLIVTQQKVYFITLGQQWVQEHDEGTNYKTTLR